MSLLLPVLFKTACPAAHHKLALDALRFLRCQRADAWRDMFLRFHHRFLAGASAPDEEFQDFGDHVLYVGQQPFGGAGAAASRWFDQLASALAERRWSDASFAAAVLSHYVSEPFLPLNTRQTAAGNLVQPGIEWSVNRSYGRLQTILEEDFGGYPAVEIPAGSDGIQQLLLRGAQMAALHYEVCIEHFDPRGALRDPEEALDQELQDRLALCLGAAVVSIARILEMAIEQTAVEPPSPDVVGRGGVALLKAPFGMLAGHTHDQILQRRLEAMSDELELTGRVDESLPREQREIRRLYGEAVLHDLSADWAACKPEASIGAHYGKGAPARYRSNRLRTGPATVRVTSLASERVGLAIAGRFPVQQPQRGQGDEPTILRFVPRLNKASPIEDFPAVTAKMANRLRAAAIDTVGDLVAADPDLLADRLRLRQGGPHTIMDWQAIAGLCCQIPQLSGCEASLLVAAGIRHPGELAIQSPREILARVSAAADRGGECRLMMASRVELRDIERWQASCRDFPVRQSLLRAA